MENTYWFKQASGKPLFPDLLWSRPENKQAAGKLLIVGGNLHGFAAPAQTYAEASNAGIGSARVILPLAVKKLTGNLFPGLEYATSTPSGSFGSQSLGELLEQSAWANGVLFAGDMGHNSETTILLENFLNKYKGPVTLTKDAIDHFYAQPNFVLDRDQTTLVITMAQLQKLAKNAGMTSAVTFSMDLLRLVDFLHELTTKHAANVIVKHLDNMLVGCSGQVSTTKLSEDLPVWRIRTAAHSAVWWLQSPDKALESLTSSLLAY